MRSKHIVFFLIAAVWGGVFTACRQQPTPDINIEQAGHPVASRILAPGMGTIGLIEDGKVYVYFVNEHQNWIPDKLSQFEIPSDNTGLLALGTGTIGVIRNRAIEFYQLDAYNHWVVNPRYHFELPRQYERIIGVRMPWEMGMIVLESKGMLDFYYFDESGHWVLDETAAFQIPEGIDHCFSLGDMTIAIADKEKLGVYYLHPEGYWDFVEEFVLQLPEGYEAIIPWETGFIAVLIGNTLEFFRLDPENDRWLYLEEMAFVLPGTFVP